MSDAFAPLEKFSGVARLFPLPNVVFYPYVMLPLHVFEPRYRQMTADALAGDRLIGLVLLRPGWEADYEGKPALHEVGCLGEIIAEQQLEDGRYNILLRGLSRVRLIHEQDEGLLYRTAQVRVLHEFAPPASPEVQEMRRRLMERVPVWLPAPGPLSQLQALLETDVPLGALCDILGYALPLDPEFKQELLKELNAIERALVLLRHLEETTPPPGEPRPFPPGFSSN